MTATQAACLFLGDLTWNALAKSILVSLLEVKFLRLGTAGPELPKGSSGSFPTAPHCVLRTVPAGQSQENLWSRMFLWRISHRALAKEQSLSYKWQICSGNRSLPQIAPSSLGTPPHSGNVLWPNGLHPASFPQACSTPQASPLALFPASAVQEPCLFFSMFPTTCMLFFFIQEFNGMLSLSLTLFQKILESLSLYSWSATHNMPPKCHWNGTVLPVKHVCLEYSVVLSKYQLESGWFVKANGLIPYKAFGTSIINSL